MALGFRMGIIIGGEPPVPDPEPVTFSYTGGIQTYEVPKTGIYTLEVWGAQGGKDTQHGEEGGKGGYAKGNVNLTQGQTIYVVVGGYPGNANSGGYNGGGGHSAGGTTGDGGCGGGATHIAKQNGLLQNISALNLFIVAGGGGGNGTHYGGTGGGETGGSGLGPSSRTSSGGTQSAGGTGGTAGFGFGAKGGYGGGGGGGYYGGGASGSYNGPIGGGGGSGYIGGCIEGTTSMENGIRNGHGQAIISWASAS